MICNSFVRLNPSRSTGPLLLLIYINDFALQSTKVTMYADDTSIWYSSKSKAEINEAVN